MSFTGRVKEEKKELDDKLEKLNKFISSKPQHEVEKITGEEGYRLLKEQARVMEEYSYILKERIELF